MVDRFVAESQKEWTMGQQGKRIVISLLSESLPNGQPFNHFLTSQIFCVQSTHEACLIQFHQTHILHHGNSESTVKLFDVVQMIFQTNLPAW